MIRAMMHGVWALNNLTPNGGSAAPFLSFSNEASSAHHRESQTLHKLSGARVQVQVKMYEHLHLPHGSNIHKRTHPAECNFVHPHVTQRPYHHEQSSCKT